ncbi:MAG TPA: hypothetical protein VII20_12220 [Roseiarcus sp.]
MAVKDELPQPNSVLRTAMRLSRKKFGDVVFPSHPFRRLGRAWLAIFLGRRLLLRLLVFARRVAIAYRVEDFGEEPFRVVFVAVSRACRESLVFVQSVEQFDEAIDAAQIARRHFLGCEAQGGIEAGDLQTRVIADRVEQSPLQSVYDNLTNSLAAQIFLPCDFVIGLAHLPQRKNPQSPDLPVLSGDPGPASRLGFGGMVQGEGSRLSGNRSLVIT